MERRKKRRFAGPFPATVWGSDATGKEFSENTDLSNLSSSGLYTQLRANVVRGERLSAEIRLSEDLAAACIRCRGQVVRVEESGDGLHGVAIKFTSKRYR